MSERADLHEMSPSDYIQILMAIAFALIGWFMRRIFGEIEKSRINERELFIRLSEESQARLRLHIELLKDQLSQVRK